MDKYQNKYRIPSARLQSWDYGNSAAYFITICTKNREHFFGEILNGEIQLNEIGIIVQNEWLKTIDLRPDMNLEFGKFIVMPNHFHAIVIIGENKYNMDRRDAMHRVSTTALNKFGPQSKNLASIIRGFKSSVTTKARKIHSGFSWQSRYHDHIIRSSAEFERIQNYITNNPSNWKDDKFYAQAT